MERSYELPWTGTPFTGDVIAVDTETVAIKGWEVPDLVLMTVTDGTRHAVVRPDQVEAFVSHLSHVEIVFHNAAFDVPVIQKHNRWAGENLLTAAEENRVHDTMLLDQLVRLGRPTRDMSLRQRPLKELAAEHCRLDVDKDVVAVSPVSGVDVPVRVHYAHLLGYEDKWQDLDSRWFDYPVLDTVATWKVYQKLVPVAKRVAERAGLRGQVLTDLVNTHGLLTEGLQVRASLALAAAGRRGMAVDHDKVQVVKERLTGYINDARDRLRATWPDTFVTYKGDSKKGVYKKGDLRTTPTGNPTVSHKYVRTVLNGIASDYELTPPVSEKTGEITVGLEWWLENAADHPFIRDWLILNENAKLMQFVKRLEETDRARTSYVTLVRTGRTSSVPNVQNWPREPWFRELFVASPGTTLVTADYSFIELCTLAAVLEKRYGRSVLADTLRTGTDPHVYTAAQVRGMGVDEFKGLKLSDPDLFKRDRQAAKAINFGVPGGLGPLRLRNYARANYGVEMDLETATALRERLITEVYPELATYLDEVKFEKMSEVLGVPIADVLNVVHDNFSRGKDEPAGDGMWMYFVIQKTLAGNPFKVNGDPYSDKLVELVWRSMDTILAMSPAGPSETVYHLIRKRQGGAELKRILFGKTAVTLTGRVRYGCDYGEARNTPFQGLAADGAKIALWKLYRQGVATVAFVHDEIVNEVPDDDETWQDNIKEVMQSAMASVVPNIPIGVAVNAGESWEKP